VSLLTFLRQELDPSAALHRRVVKLVIARGGSDEEISTGPSRSHSQKGHYELDADESAVLAAFLGAAKATAIESEGGLQCVLSSSLDHSF